MNYSIYSCKSLADLTCLSLFLCIFDLKCINIFVDLIFSFLLDIFSPPTLGCLGCKKLLYDQATKDYNSSVFLIPSKYLRHLLDGNYSNLSTQSIFPCLKVVLVKHTMIEGNINCAYTVHMD